MRLALLDFAGAGRELAGVLAAAGHESDLIRVRPFPDAPLRLRKIGERPGRIPAGALALARGDYDVAHAFSAEDGVAAVTWSRITGRPAVLTLGAPLDRARLADRRLRLAALRLAAERSAAVLAPDEVVADSLWRWLAVRPRVVERGSAEAHELVYRELTRR